MADSRKKIERPRSARKPVRRRGQPSRHRSAVRSGCLSRYIWGIFAAVAGVMLLVAAAAFLGLSGHQGDPEWIRIPREATDAQVRDSLKMHLGTDFGNKVFALWKLQGGQDAHGAYRVSHGRSAFSLARAMAKGRQTPVRVTFTGARFLDQIAGKITAPLEMTPREFLAACDSILPGFGYKSKEEYPAAFIPDTYEYYWTVRPDTLVSRLARSTRRFWTDERVDKAKALGMTPVQVATIASIVEEETVKADERPTVARLYINRWKKGMKLQADPTVKYAVGDFSLRRINSRHLKTPSPYNTYLNPGLPPGPIRIPEAATIDAVLDAPRHPYIYMCAKDDFSGRHNFAVSYEEHLANAARYQRALNVRGIH